MNKSLLITTAISAGASLLLYMLKRRMRSGRTLVQDVAEHGRHLTNVFAKAKHNTASALS